MKLSTEVKVGIIGVITALLLIWGINYLKGRDMLKSAYVLHAYLPESGSIDHSAPVLLKGVKIGYVDDVVLRTEEEMPIELILHIEKKYSLGRGSLALLSSADLLGSKAIRIETVPGPEFLEHEDTIDARLEKDLFAMMQEKALPMLEQFGGLATSLDSLSNSINLLVSNEDLSRSLEHLESITASLEEALASQGSLNQSFKHLESFTATLEESEDDMAVLLENLGKLSADLEAAGLDKLGSELQGVAGQLNLVLRQINSGEGSLGMLLYSDSLHVKLTSLISDLDSLVVDLHENPQDYVQISVFGKKDKGKD